MLIARCAKCNKCLWCSWHWGELLSWVLINPVVFKQLDCHPAWLSPCSQPGCHLVSQSVGYRAQCFCLSGTYTHHTGQEMYDLQQSVQVAVFVSFVTCCCLAVHMPPGCRRPRPQPAVQPGACSRNQQAAAPDVGAHQAAACVAAGAHQCSGPGGHPLLVQQLSHVVHMPLLVQQSRAAHDSSAAKQVASLL